MSWFFNHRFRPFGRRTDGKETQEPENREVERRPTPARTPVQPVNRSDYLDLDTLNPPRQSWWQRYLGRRAGGFVNPNYPPSPPATPTRNEPSADLRPPPPPSTSPLVIKKLPEKYPTWSSEFNVQAPYPPQEHHLLGRSRSHAGLNAWDEPSSDSPPSHLMTPQRSSDDLLSALNRLNLTPTTPTSSRRRAQRDNEQVYTRAERYLPLHEDHQADDVNPQRIALRQPTPILQVTRSQNRSRLLSRSPPPGLAREMREINAPPVGKRMYTFSSNPGRLVESSGRQRAVFYDPRTQFSSRDPKKDIHNHGNLRDLLKMVVKFTRIESCDEENEEEVKRMEKEIFGIERKTEVKKLGSGLYGEVFMVRRTDSKKDFAMKVYHTRAMMDPVTLQEQDYHRKSLVVSLQEVIVMRILKTNPLFVKIIDHFIINEKIYIVMEMEDGSLESQIKYFHPDGMIEDKARKWFWQMAQGLEYMHRIGITHGDIHTGNVLIRKLSNNTTLCKWTDFGRSTFLPHAYKNVKGWISDEKREASGRPKEKKDHRNPLKKQLQHLWAQDFREIQLEMAESNAISIDIDMMGRILVSMMKIPHISDIPKFTREEYLTKVSSKKYVKTEDGKGRLASFQYSMEARDLVWSLLAKEKSDQIGADQMINHVWFLRPGTEPGFRRPPLPPVIRLSDRVSGSCTLI